MANLVVIGTQWGDEGKGKIVDMLSEQADVVVRFGGGNNAGHTLVVQGRQTILHLIPSGVLHPGKRVVLGDGMVVDPEALLTEMDQLDELGLTLGPEQLLVSSKAHLVLPYHRVIDELREGTEMALGTTRRGVGPAYEDKTARRGLRVGDLLRPARLRVRLTAALGDASSRIEALGGEAPTLEPTLNALTAQAERLRPHITDTSLFLDKAARAGKRLLFEGAQGVLLDLDHGTYPFVTSSTTLGGGMAAGAGFAAHRIDRVIGVAKAYVTRVGDGPFPTEIQGAAGEFLRKKGHEYGATTGRPRRCGWLDLPALRYAVRVGGVRALALTKLDVLSGTGTLPVCVAYRIGEQRVEEFPPDLEDLEQATPELEQLDGFTGDLSATESYEALPDGAQQLVATVERETKVPVGWVSVGPGREQTLRRQLPDL